MKRWSKAKKILALLVLLFLLAQAIRPAQNRGSASGPKDITTIAAVPDSVMTVLKASCYDCHSNHTDYPWWDQIAPVSWWISNHVNEGKRHLNFTEIGSYAPKKQAKKFDETAELTEKGEMPLNSYLWMHADAKLSPQQQKMIVDWAKAAEAAIPQQ